MAKKAERWLLCLARNALAEKIADENIRARHSECEARFFETEVFLLLQAKRLNKSCPVNGRARKVFAEFCAVAKPHYFEQEWREALLLAEDHFGKRKEGRSWK